MAEGESDYESDPEEAKLSLKLRRREASDDEEEENLREKPPRRIDNSDRESEDAAWEYEDELEEEEEEEYDLDEEYVEEIEEVVAAVERVESGEGAIAVVEEEEEKKGVYNEATCEVDDENINGAEGQHEEETKTKDAEPFAVPTAGAFYMHDDRFQDSAGGRHRRTLGGRKLWESKDDRKWGHDKFEELTVHERHFEELRRGSRGRNRGRGKNRGAEQVHAQVNRPEEYSNNNNQSSDPKSVKGRGPRRYQRSFKNSNGAPLSQSKQSGKSVENHSYVNSGRTYEPVSNTKSDVTLPIKQVASSLNIASPPFYPTGSSTKDNTMPLKRDVQAGAISCNSQQSVVDEKFHMAQSTATVRRKNIVDSIGVENLYIDDLPSGKPSNSMQVPPSQLQSQERGLTSMQMAYKPIVSKNQFNRGPSSQMHNVQRNPGQSQVHNSVPQGTQRLPSGPQASKASGAVNAFESGEVESALEYKTTVVAAKGKGTVQGSGKGPFLYGAQVMGSGHSDQNFPTFLPVMQFGRQHPGGIGVPAVGMAFPGYVAQPQLGLGSSEMTWLPVLAGAAGALGASYCSPYISMDGSYNAQPSGQASSIAAASSKENNAAKVGNDGMPAQRPELANDDFGQRQKNPRRYTEMKFDQ